MSQAGRPRPRYIAFKVDADRRVGRQAVANALKGRARHEGLAGDAMPRLTRYDFPHGVVWADHRWADQVRAMLGRITWVVEGGQKVPVGLEAILTSGTIKRLTQRTGVLRERGKKPGGD